MEEQPHRSYYAIIPANVRYDEDLPPNAKLLFGEITALCNERGYCWASNNYFAELYGVTKISVSKWVNILIKKGYLISEIIYREGTREIDKRVLRIPLAPIKEKFNTYDKKVNEGIKEKFNTPIKEKFKDNNTLKNTTVNNIVNSDELTENTDFEMVKTKKRKKEIPDFSEQSPTKNYTLLMAIYYEWYKEINGVTPKIDGVEGKAMKQLQAYFEGLAKAKIKTDNDNEEMPERKIEATPELISEKACEIFEYILSNWLRLEQFLQKQVKLSQINSNITNIIHDLKNGRKNKSTQQAKSDRAGTIVEGFAAIEKAFRS